MITELENAIKANDTEAVQDAIFNLSVKRHSDGLLPDEIAFEIIDILRRNEMKTSPLAGHLLNYFEFEAPYISSNAKDLCIRFLNAWGKDFKHVHSSQVVAELQSGEYLNKP